MKEINLFADLYEYTKKLDTKIGKKVFNYLDSEPFYIVCSDDKYWFEYYNFNYPNYPTADVRRWIDRYLRKKGYTFLFDI